MRAALLSALSEAAIAQSPPPPAAVTLPRTADGHPDLQGVWEFRWRTFLVRMPGTPAKLRDEADADKLVARQIAGFRAQPGNTNPESDQDVTTLLKIGGEYRSSLIVDPPDGQIPWLPGKRPGMPPMGSVDNPEERARAERCIAMPNVPVIPIPSNSFIQVIQPPGAVVMIPEALGQIRHTVLGTQGDVRSRWEGDTLVVESRNLTPDQRFTQPITIVGFSQATTVSETFTPVSANEIIYRYTITDPTLYARSWTAETVWARSTHRLFEYACHEGNYALANILMGSRVQDAH